MKFSLEKIFRIRPLQNMLGNLTTPNFRMRINFTAIYCRVINLQDLIRYMLSTVLCRVLKTIIIMIDFDQTQFLNSG